MLNKKVKMLNLILIGVILYLLLPFSAVVKGEEAQEGQEIKKEEGVKKEEEKKGRKGPFMAAIQPVEKTFPAGYSETWKAILQALTAIGESLAATDKESGIISTQEKELRGGMGYGIGKHSRHSMNVVVNKITDEKTKVSIKRRVMVRRSFFVGSSTSEDPSDGSIEEDLFKNISSLLNVQPVEGFEIEKVAWKRGDPFPNRK